MMPGFFISGNVGQQDKQKASFNGIHPFQMPSGGTSFSGYAGFSIFCRECPGRITAITTYKFAYCR